MTWRRLQRHACGTVVVIIVAMVCSGIDLHPGKAAGEQPGDPSARGGETSRDPWRHTPSTGAEATAAFPIWKTITLGTYADVNVLREALDSPHCALEGSLEDIRRRDLFRRGTSRTTPRCALGDLASEIIGRPSFVLSKTHTHVNLVVLSVAELGFGDEGATAADVYLRARQLGFELCPAEVGPQLRLQYLDQPVGEFLHIAMEPIATYGGELVDLTVGNGGAGLLLIGGASSSDAVMPSALRFVFVRPTRIARPTNR